MKKSRCVIFGASGFIGGYLVEELIKKSYPVLAISRNRQKLEDKLSHLKGEIEFATSDLMETEQSVNLIKQGDIVFDLVSSSVPATSVKKPIQEITNNILPHANFFMQVCEKRAGKIIFASSGGSIYGNMGGKSFLETDLPNPQSPHAIAKLTTEYFLKYFCQSKQIPFTIFRISNPFGVGQKKVDGFGVIPTFLENIKTNTPPVLFNQGKLVRDFIHVSDLVEAIVLSLEKPNQYPLYNLGSGQGLSIKEIWNILKTASNSNLSAIYDKRREFDIEKIVLDISRFSQEFSWQPKTDIKKAIGEMGKSIL